MLVVGYYTCSWNCLAHSIWYFKISCEVSLFKFESWVISQIWYCCDCYIPFWYYYRDIWLFLFPPSICCAFSAWFYYRSIYSFKNLAIWGFFISSLSCSTDTWPFAVTKLLFWGFVEGSLAWFSCWGLVLLWLLFLLTTTAYLSGCWWEPLEAP